MLKEGVIPPVYASYYESLPASKKVKDIATWIPGSIGPYEAQDLEDTKYDIEIVECMETDNQSQINMITCYTSI